MEWHPRKGQPIETEYSPPARLQVLKYSAGFSANVGPPSPGAVLKNPGGFFSMQAGTAHSY